MTIIYVLIPIAIILTLVGIYLFFWAVKSEQFTDLEKQGLSILFDEDEVNPSSNDQAKENTPDKTANNLKNPHNQVNDK